MRKEVEWIDMYLSGMRKKITNLLKMAKDKYEGKLVLLPLGCVENGKPMDRYLIAQVFEVNIVENYVEIVYDFDGCTELSEVLTVEQFDKHVELLELNNSLREIALRLLFGKKIDINACTNDYIVEFRESRLIDETPLNYLINKGYYVRKSMLEKDTYHISKTKRKGI